MLRGSTALDWLIVLLIVMLAVRGLIRGTIGQVFSLLGLLAGLYAAGWVAQWVGQHWQSARPTVLFLALRWLVAGLAGLALAALFQWWGEVLRGAIGKSPVGWLDRMGGVALGAALGIVVGGFIMLTALLATWPRTVSDVAARSRTAVPLMAGGAKLCGLDNRYFPGSGWRRQRFLLARQRAHSQSRHF